MITRLSLTLTLAFLTLLTHPVTAQASGTGTGTGGCAPVTWTDPTLPSGAAAAPQPAAPTMPSLAGNLRTGKDLLPGDINCRLHGRTYADDDDADRASWCAKLALRYETSLDKFFQLNPFLAKDCSNIEADAMYCVKGFIEPLRSRDGRCGPPHGNATCAGYHGGQCCNSETWTCGDSPTDCAPGTCHEGACPGHSWYSTDGTCGSRHANRLCAGKWGVCCSSLTGQCGSGPEYCSFSSCQSGACEWPSPRPWLDDTPSTSTSTSISPIPVSIPPDQTVACSAGVGVEVSMDKLCSYSCSHGFCPSQTCTCFIPGLPLPPGEQSGVGRRGYALLSPSSPLRNMRTFDPLCDFACSHGFCPGDTCTTEPYYGRRVPGGTVCVAGTSLVAGDGYEELCGFVCAGDFCDGHVCRCLLWGRRGLEMRMIREGRDGDGEMPVLDRGRMRSMYHGVLCGWACRRGWCPREHCPRIE